MIIFSQIILIHEICGKKKQFAKIRVIRVICGKKSSNMIIFK